MIIDICEGKIYDFVTRKAICCVDEIHHQKKEIIMMIINALIQERDRLEDDLSTFEYKVERLEDELEMYEDNFGIEE